MKRILTSCFGLGRLPVAPGSWGSLPPVIIFAVMCRFQMPGTYILVVMTILALAGSVVCVKFTPAVIGATGDEDPPEVVADELAGQAITFMPLTLLAQAALSSSQLLVTAAVGFLLFRAFDTIKPWPANKLEKLPKGWGVLADDLMAGVYAAIALVLCARFGWLEYLSTKFQISNFKLPGVG